MVLVFLVFPRAPLLLEEVGVYSTCVTDCGRGGVYSTCVTDCGMVIALVNRLQTGSRSPRVSPHYCITGGVKFLQGEGSAVIHRMKTHLLYKDATCLCSLSVAF